MKVLIRECLLGRIRRSIMEMNKMNKNITEEEIEELRIKYTKRELAYMFLQLRNLYYQNKMEMNK
tara:strand:+ start:423 stop:617 length:195 start_codon:yes stop_codon:yes gene_type:complete